MLYNLADLPNGTVVMWLGAGFPHQMEVGVVTDPDEGGGRVLIVASRHHYARSQRAGFPTLASDNELEVKLSDHGMWLITYLPRPVAPW